MVKLSSNLLYFFLEGSDDESFFKRIIKPLLLSKNRYIDYYPYAGKPLEWRVNFISSCNSISMDYVYVKDFNDAPCIPAKKEEIIDELAGRITEDKILVVVQEIESWYLAGLDDHSLRQFGITGSIPTTDGITKEDFNRLVPKDKTPKEFKLEILDIYDINTAIVKNRSFRYFFNNWIL